MASLVYVYTLIGIFREVKRVDLRLQCSYERLATSKRPNGERLNGSKVLYIFLLVTIALLSKQCKMIFLLIN